MITRLRHLLLDLEKLCKAMGHGGIFKSIRRLLPASMDARDSSNDMRFLGECIAQMGILNMLLEKVERERRQRRRHPAKA